MNPIKRARKYVEILLVFLGMAVIPPLPRKAVMALARTLARLAYFFDPHLRKVGYANLQIAFGDSISNTRKREILLESYIAFALVVLDMFWFSRKTAERISAHVSFDRGFDRLFQNKRQVCITGHFGNWEIMGQAVALRGTPLVSVAAPLANPVVDVLFNRLRTTTRQQVLSKHGAVRGLLKTLNQEGKIAILLDQNTRPDEGGVFVDFFGLPVPVSSAGAALSLRTKAEIFFGFCLPQPDGSYRAHSPGCLSPETYDSLDTRQAIDRLTREIARILENEIKANPGAWLWMYKRWKYIPSGRLPSEYPFYAKPI